MIDQSTLSASLEDYLEAIYNIIRENQAVRAKDIAERLGVSNASVTGALRTLAKREYLNYEPYGVITLTPEGEKIAREIARRHQILKDFLVKVLWVDVDEADEAACKMEHGIPPGLVDRLIDFIEFIEVCPLGGERLAEGFRRHLKCGQKRDSCDQCVGSATVASPSPGSKGPVIRLSGLKDGQKGTIQAIRTKGALRKRLMDMGLVPGAVVEMVRVAPMGDPLEVKVRGYFLSLRKDELEKVEVSIREGGGGEARKAG